MISRCIKYSVVIFGEWKGIFSLKLHHEKKKKMKRQVKPMKIMQFTLVTIGVLKLCCTTLVADKIRTMVLLSHAGAVKSTRAETNGKKISEYFKVKACCTRDLCVCLGSSLIPLRQMLWKTWVLACSQLPLPAYHPFVPTAAGHTTACFSSKLPACLMYVH